MSRLVALTAAVGAASIAACAVRAQDARPRAGYRATSPHWPHLRVQVTDYRIQYQADANARMAEYEWAARRFDRIILDFGDKRSVPVYRRLNPTAEVYRYALSWTVVQPGSLRSEDAGVAYYTQMLAWYGRHPEFRLEDAFLHDRRCGPAGGRPANCRVTLRIWNQDRWVINPGDAGLRAYHRERLAAVAADADGLFLDEHSAYDFRSRLDPSRLVEYADWGAYERDMLVLLRGLRAAIGPRKRILLNTATSVTPFDLQMVGAAGGTHAEAFNNPFFPEMEKRWRFAESVLAAGGRMDLPPGGDMPSGYTPGNSGTSTDRRRLWELASYYLVAPEVPGLLAYNPGNKWKEPFAKQWVPAAEVDVGTPRGPRQVFTKGRDRSGRAYRVWAREYDGALVLVRPLVEWGPAAYGDETGVELRLPPGGYAYRPLHADGRVGAALTGVVLRAGEAAVLLTSRGRSADAG
ncbi:MAG: hypothetical protein M3282_07845, partial [Gemmatimonadota bacterium]|nr:hypothetical protein [Gemmatimonadota bacterium]